MLPNWKKRPNTVASLLNPAFCGEVLKRTIFAYQKVRGIGMPYQLLFLILPIILNKEIRDSLPKTSRKRFVTWLEENQIYIKDLPKSIKSMIPYTKESTMFLLMYKKIEINEDGCFEALGNNARLNTENEVVDCFKKASMLGKLLAKTGNSQFIFSSLGIKP